MSTVASLPNEAKYIVRLEYSPSEASGITAVVVVSCLGLIAVVGLLAAISMSAFNTRTSLDHHLFTRMHVAAYFISLLVGNFLQALSSIINVSWVASKGVYVGNTCTAQGIIKHIADLSMAIWILAIAVHTFCFLVLGIKIRRFTLIATMVSGWSGTFALVIIGPAVLDTKTRGPYFGISGYWCWITDQYPTERIVLDYLFMFISALFSLILYLLIFLHFRGNPTLSRLRARFRDTSLGNSSDPVGDEFELKGMEIAKKMSLYPVAYSIVVLPISVIQLSTWTGSTMPFPAVIFSVILFQMSGIVNVILFFTMGRVLPRQSIISLKREISRPQTFKPPPSTLDPRISDPYYASSTLPPVPPMPSIPEKFLEPEPHPKDSIRDTQEVEQSVAPLQIRKPRPEMLSDIESTSRFESVYDYYGHEGRRPVQNSDYEQDVRRRSQDSYYERDIRRRSSQDSYYEPGRSGDSYKDVNLEDTPIEQAESDDSSVYSD